MVGSAHEQHLGQQVLQWLSVCSKVQLFAYGPANAIASPSSLVSLKSRMVYLSGTGCLTQVVLERKSLNKQLK